MIRVYVGAGLADMRTLTGTGALPETIEGYAGTSGLRSSSTSMTRSWSSR